MYLTRGADLPSDSVKTYACYVDINGRDNSDGSVPANNKGWESRYTVPLEKKQHDRAQL